MDQIFHRVKMLQPFIWTIYCFHEELNHGVNQLLSADRVNRSCLLCHLLVIHNLLALSGSWTGPHILPNPMRVTLGKSIMFEMYFCIFQRKEPVHFSAPQTHSQKILSWKWAFLMAPLQQPACNWNLSLFPSNQPPFSSALISTDEKNDKG